MYRFDINNAYNVWACGIFETKTVKSLWGYFAFRKLADQDTILWLKTWSSSSRKSGVVTKNLLEFYEASSVHMLRRDGHAPQIKVNWYLYKAICLQRSKKDFEVSHTGRRHSWHSHSESWSWSQVWGLQSIVPYSWGKGHSSLLSVLGHCRETLSPFLLQMK